MEFGGGGRKPDLRTCLSCEQLDDRICPTADTTFAFTLPNDDTGAGSFTLPVSQVDRTQPLQQIAVTDLSLTLGNETFTGNDFVGGVTADFTGGVFLGLTFEVKPTATGFAYANVAVGHGTVQAIDTASDYATSGVAYTLPSSALPDTRFAFTLPNGDAAVASFTMPISQIDPNQASQHLSVSDLSVTLLGETFTSGDFASVATADFENGVFQGVTFEVGSTPFGFAYTDLSVDGSLVTATDATTSGEVVTAASFVAPAAVAVPQHTVTTDSGTVTLNGTTVSTYSGNDFTIFGVVYTADPRPDNPDPPEVPPTTVPPPARAPGRAYTQGEQQQLTQLNNLLNKLNQQKTDIEKQIKTLNDQIALANQVVQVTQKALDEITAKIADLRPLVQALQTTPWDSLTAAQRRIATLAGINTAQGVLDYWNQLLAIQKALKDVLAAQQTLLAGAKQKLASLNYDLAKANLKIAEVKDAILTIVIAAQNNLPEATIPAHVLDPSLNGGIPIGQALAGLSISPPAGYIPYTPTPSLCT